MSLKTHTPAVPLGIVFPASAPAERLAGFADRVERSGYDELWVIEDCFLSGGVTLAATALAVTSRIRVGVGLLPAAVRNAAITAMEIATLARMHPGRVSVAFGHGVESWMRQIDARPQRRVRALGEVVTAIKLLLAGQTVDFDGSFVKLSAVTLERPPRTEPEILIGTTGAQGIALAGRRADGLLLPEGCGPRFIAYARGLAAQGRRASEPVAEVVAYTWLRFGPDEQARAALTGPVSQWRSSGLFPGPVELAGVDTLPVGEPISRAVADQLGVVGDPVQCSAAVARFASAGADRVVLTAVGSDFEDQYAEFAAEVMPALREVPRADP